MSEETVVEQPVLEVKEYKFQPTDDEDRPIGGLQVIKYTTPEDLNEKLREQNVLLIRKLRQETKKVRLGIVENEAISEDAQKFDGWQEFTPRELTDDERYSLAKKLQDPTTAFEAFNTIVEAQVGAPLDKISQEVSSLRQDNLALKAKIEANAFVADNPDYYKCQENFEAITAWMVRYGLFPSKENYQKAYDTLYNQGVIIRGPAAHKEVIPVIEQVPVQLENKVIEQPVIPVGIASGLNNENSSSYGVAPAAGSDIIYEVIVGGQKIVLTGLKAVDAMSSEEYKKRLLTDKDFSKKVEKLEADLRKPRA